MVEQAASIEDATTSPKAQDAGGVTSYVILSGLTAASSGLIFGYNIGISGTCNMQYGGAQLLIVCLIRWRFLLLLT
jgi:hypothetical protein